jgi:hypothetical protein
VEIIQQEFAAMVADRSARCVGAPPHQPLDQAELEPSPGRRRQAEVALRYWRELLSRMPQCLYATPGTAPAGESLCAGLSSVAGALAAAAIAARTSRASIVLAAIGAVLAQRTGYRDLLFPPLSSNRFEPRLTRYVGTLAQGCLTALDVCGFAALVRRTWTAVLESCRHKPLRRLPPGRDGAADRARPRGAFQLRAAVQQRCRRNRSPEPSLPVGGDRPGPAVAQLAVRGRSTSVNWWPMPASPSPLRFDLCRADEVLRLDLWTGDTGRVSSDELRSLLLAVEDLLVAAAAGDLDADQVREAVRLEPIVRGPGWSLVDSLLSRSGRGAARARQGVRPGYGQGLRGSGRWRLVAYLAEGASVRDPAQAHARCMAGLAGHPTALAPHHYVVCAATPADHRPDR